jgi:curli biogenesis system outer membrane secretion channel CsgG
MKSLFTTAFTVFGIVFSLISCANAQTAKADQKSAVGDAVAVNEKKLPAKGDKVAVTLYEFRSSVPELNVRGATDMFKTALFATGRFKVVERTRINEGVVREKQLNAAGQTTGKTAQSLLTGAEFIFEVSITEANAGESQDQGGINIGGLQLGGTKAQDSVGLDVRIVDANNGEILDAISVRKNLNTTTSGVSGTAALAQTIASLKGKVLSPLTPDLTVQTNRKDSFDKALRGAIDDAVSRLGARFVLHSD